MNKEDLKLIDFNFWNNAKRDIILALLNSKDIDSVCEMARIINKSFSVTYNHLIDLQMRGIVIFRKINRGNKRMISLRNPYYTIDEILHRTQDKSDNKV